jgi:mgtE-like transporter
MWGKDLIGQSLPLLIICGMGEIIVGSFFGQMDLESLPGLIVLVPAVIGLRGNISIALGSRLGSGFHLGVITFAGRWKEEVRENVTASLLLSILMSLIIGILAYVTCEVLGFPHMDMVYFAGIALFAGFTSGVILAFLAILTVYVAFRRGYDPDNITGPILATIGDIITITCLFGSAMWFSGGTL